MVTLYRIRFHANSLIKQNVKCRHNHRLFPFYDVSLFQQLLVSPVNIGVVVSSSYDLEIYKIDAGRNIKMK